MTFTATLADVNAALSSLSFTPNANFFGAANLTITVNDLGNSGSGGPQSTVKLVAINVAAVDDLPVFSGSTSVTLDEGSTITLNSTTLRLADVDTAANDLVFTVNSISTGGQLRLNSVTLRTGDSFTQADIDAAAVTYVHLGGELPSEQFNLGLSDRFGVQLLPVTINVVVAPVNDAPDITGIQGGAINEVTTNGSYVATVLEVDPDNLTGAVFSLLDSAQGTFAINAQTGVITVFDASKIDFEKASVMTVRVRVTDVLGVSSERSFAIQINDISEFVPIAPPVNPNSTPVTVVPRSNNESVSKPSENDSSTSNRNSADTALATPLAAGGGESGSVAAASSKNGGSKKATNKDQWVDPDAGNVVIKISEQRKSNRLALTSEMIEMDSSIARRINFNGEMIERLMREARNGARNAVVPPSVNLSDFTLPKSAQTGVIEDGSIDSKGSKSKRYEVFIDSVQMGGMVLSVGVVAWVARTGGLLAALISALPAWKGLDPLLVLSSNKSEEESELQEFSDTNLREDEEAVKAVLA